MVGGSEAAVSAGAQKTRMQVSVPVPAYDELVRLQQEWEAAHPGGTISLSTLISQAVRLLAGQPVQP